MHLTEKAFITILNQLKSNQMMVLGEGENRSTERKTSWSRVENQQTQPTCDAESGNQTRGTLVEDESSHHCANPVPLNQNMHWCKLPILIIWIGSYR